MSEEAVFWRMEAERAADEQAEQLAAADLDPDWPAQYE